MTRLVLRPAVRLRDVSSGLVLTIDAEAGVYFADEPEHLSILRDTLRRFIAAEMPRDAVRRWDREHRFPPELFRKLAALGVCGHTIDETYGGQGRDLVAAVAVIEELCRRGSFAAGPFIHCAFYGGINVSENGSEQQKRALLPRLARGELLFAYGLSEPDVGGDLASVRTTARRSADGRQLVLNGVKRWCTDTTRPVLSESAFELHLTIRSCMNYFPNFDAIALPRRILPLAFLPEIVV